MYDLRKLSEINSVKSSECNDVEDTKFLIIQIYSLGISQWKNYIFTFPSKCYFCLLFENGPTKNNAYKGSVLSLIFISESFLSVLFLCFICINVYWRECIDFSSSIYFSSFVIDTVLTDQRRTLRRMLNFCQWT